jgi:transglutaminase-like putative cysteine protease
VSYVDTRSDSAPFHRPLAGIPAPLAVLAGLPGGKAGTVATLKHMKEYVRQALRNPSQKIREQALAIFRAEGLPPRKYNLEMAALHAFVRDAIRYVKDPVGLELVQAPERTLEIGQGDCDDKSTLLAALLMATGHPCRFTAIGFKDRPFSHVLVEARSGVKWVPMETIIQKPMGWFPTGVTSKYSLNL